MGVPPYMQIHRELITRIVASSRRTGNPSAPSQRLNVEQGRCRFRRRLSSHKGVKVFLMLGLLFCRKKLFIV